MTRRRLFGLITLAAIGFVANPSLVLRPNDMLTEGAITWLTRRYNDFVKGLGGGRPPKVIMVSQWLFDQYESELTCVKRFTDQPTNGQMLYFKATRVIVNPQFSGLEYSIGG